MNHVVIQKIAHLPPQILELEKEAVEGGFRFLTRLIQRRPKAATFTRWMMCPTCTSSHMSGPNKNF